MNHELVRRCEALGLGTTITRGPLRGKTTYAVRLAAITGASPRTASRWLSGETEPPMILWKLLDARDELDSSTET